MARYEFDIGILGGGSAGLTAAAGASRFGAKTLLVEKRALGGDCLYYGCVPSKTLIETARVYHLMRGSRRYGLPACEPPPVDFNEVSRRIRSVIGEIERVDSVERFCRLGARVEFGEPVFVDEHAIRIGKQVFSAKNWLISTGSSPAVPDIPGLRGTGLLSNRDLFSLEKLPRSMIILGGGPVGIEMAQAFGRLGTSVTVVQKGDQILEREDKDMAGMVLDILAREGIVFYLNAAVVAVQENVPGGPDKEVTIRTEGATRTLRAEAVLAALGRKANIGELNLECLGVQLDSQGLQLDDRLRTNYKHIYGAGDATGHYLFTHAAGYEAGIVLSNSVLHLPRKTDYRFMPWCTFTDPELASIGMNETRARAAGIRYSVWIEPFAENDRSLAEGGGTGSIKMVLDEREKPIGIQILGTRAGDLLCEWVAALNGGIRMSTMASAIHPYPTLGEINKKVAGKFLSEKLFSDTLRSGLKLFFGLKGRACEPSL